MVLTSASCNRCLPHQPPPQAGAHLHLQPTCISCILAANRSSQSPGGGTGHSSIRVSAGFCGRAKPYSSSSSSLPFSPYEMVSSSPAFGQHTCTMTSCYKQNNMLKDFCRGCSIAGASLNTLWQLVGRTAGGASPAAKIDAACMTSSLHDQNCTFTIPAKNEC